MKIHNLSVLRLKNPKFRGGGSYDIIKKLAKLGNGV